jgi:dolichol-phosphate mannosyltransferase
MRNMAATDPHLVCISLSRNFGHQPALTAGFSFCRGERVLVLDSDLQDPPELLPQMMARMDAGNDVVYGQRTARAGENWFKKCMASAFYRLLRDLVDIDIPAETGEFRLMSRRVVDALNAMPEQHRFIRGMVSWIGLRQEALPYERDKRFSGQSQYSLRKLNSLAIDAITSFSVRPLRLAAYLGLLSGLCAMLLLIYVFGRWVSGVPVHGWASLMGVVLLIGSAQLFVLSLIGEYLGRLYIESKRRPLFLVDEIASTGRPVENAGVENASAENASAENATAENPGAGRRWSDMLT